MSAREVREVAHARRAAFRPVDRVVDVAAPRRSTAARVPAGDIAQRKDIATQIQLRVLEGGVIAPLGEAKAPTSVRRGVVSGLLKAPAVLYWNVQKNQP